MARGRVPFNAIAACGAPPRFGAPEADFNAAILREQYRSLARLGPYVHGIVIVAALAFFGAAPTGSLLTGMLLPTALDRVRRKVRAASVLGPTLTFAFALATAIATWQGGVVEFALALLAVWVVATVCAMCLNRIAREANLIVIAATAFLIIAFVARGSELTLGLAPLVAIAACFIIRMLDEHFRMFAEIVRSRFIIAEQQRVAEAAREAAMTIALTDDLTGLPNRRCFQSLLADRITAATETGESFALGLIDLDGFKPINDAHGHPVGDEILKQVADRLANAMDTRGSAVRMGGDEFAILCEGIGGRNEAMALGAQIHSIFAAPFVVQSRSISLSCACGFALFPSSAIEPSELVRQADAALYRAKAGEPGGAAVFDASVGRTGSGVSFEDACWDANAESEGATRTEALTRLRA
jgi:diguanylate cyclase (GGDEF)-like protein